MLNCQWCVIQRRLEPRQVMTDLIRTPPFRRRSRVFRTARRVWTPGLQPTADCASTTVEPCRGPLGVLIDSVRRVRCVQTSGSNNPQPPRGAVAATPSSPRQVTCRPCQLVMVNVSSCKECRIFGTSGLLLPHRQGGRLHARRQSAVCIIMP